MRLFVALNLPAEVRAAIHAAAEPMRRALPSGVAWAPVDKLHVTLQFLGDVDPSAIAPLREAVYGGGRRSNPLQLMATSLGAFPDMRRPRVLWAGIVANPALSVLYQTLTDATARLGFQLEARPYHPHVTLGRVRVGARIDERVLETVVGAASFEIVAEVGSVDLMESAIGPGGARYRLVASGPLGNLATEV